jgi:ferredoxin--NADP+ reductase
MVMDLECVPFQNPKSKIKRMQLNNQNKHELKPVKITGNEEISPNVFVVSWKRERDFNPGQVVKISADLLDPPRIYSICSGNREENISVLFNVKPGGALTPRLAQMKPGEVFYVSEPYGSFTCDETPAHWIATGTGIAPFYSMIRSGRFKYKKLLHGVSYVNQFYFEDFLKKELGDQYICCCSRETEGNHFAGRITDYLLAQPELPKGDKYYLCGQALMVVEVRDLLIQKGIPYGQIYAEIFF